MSRARSVCPLAGERQRAFVSYALIAASAVALMVVTAAAPAHAGNENPAQPAAQGISFGDWLLACAPNGGKQSCDLSQTVRDSRNRRIIQLAAKRAGTSAYVELIVPVGISIPYGVSVNLAGDVKLQAPLADCSATGCRAVLPIDAQTRQQFSSAAAMAVTFQNFQKRQGDLHRHITQGVRPRVCHAFGRALGAQIEH